MLLFDNQFLVMETVSLLLLPCIYTAMICDPVVKNIEHYHGFLCSTPIDDAILLVINVIQQPGQWNTNCNDILLLALANYTERRVKIFLSNRSLRVIEVRPTMCAADIVNPIY